MTPLRQRFIEDMNLAGLKAGTQTTYIRAVQLCARTLGNTPPQNLAESQVEAYIRQRHREIAEGTFYAEFAALKALFYRTLGRDWAIFTKKKSRVHTDSVCPSPSRTKNVSA